MLNARPDSARDAAVRRLLPLLLLALLPTCTLVRPPSTPPPAAEQLPQPLEAAPAHERAELLWDSYGVPHIFAEDAAALFYAFGWAQMRSHGNLLLRLYGQARGRAAEYWGERFLESDEWVLTNAIPARAAEWLTLQSPHMRAYLEAFVAGINGFAAQHADELGEIWRAALPVAATDVLAHQQRVLQYTFMASPFMATAAQRQLQAVPGSNAWAVAPARSASRNALLLMNPHLPWTDLFTWYEAHLVAPGIDAYGATLVGSPTLSMAFNEHLGWAHTVNTIDSADLYELTTLGDAYIFDGAARPFETEEHVLRVAQPDGSSAERRLTVRRSVHGPVIAERPGRAIALRVAGLDAPRLPDQYWDMLRATDIAQFEAVLSRLQLPMFTVMYADAAGNILHVFNGAVPLRPRGDWAYWQGMVPGDTSATLWTQTHSYRALPRVLNPGSGWLQNANDPPWTTTIPFPLEPALYPPYMAPQRPMSFRAQRSARMLAENPRISFDDLVSLKHSTRMEAADHLVNDVVAAARSLGDSTARAAADVLERWDRGASADSRGAVLFQAFYRALARQRWPAGSPFEVPWSPRAPLTTPDGLSDPAAAAAVLSRAAQQIAATYGALDVPWGEVHRLRMDDVDLPASGGSGELGIFRAIDFEPLPGDTTRFAATGGDSFIATIEFSTPVRARALLAYGNASQPGSPHRTDQLALFARNELRPVWLTREEVLANLSRRERF
jgi:acyl-homoserine-lactone acylase